MDVLIVLSFLCVLAVVAWTDHRTMEIPDILPAAILFLSVAAYLTGREPDLFSRFIGFFSVSLPMLLMTLAIPGAFGGGDIKLMAACGAFLGWRTALESSFFAILGGGIWGIWLLISGKAGRKDHFAFGPFLCAGAVIAFFGGDQILGWYLSLLP